METNLKAQVDIKYSGDPSYGLVRYPNGKIMPDTGMVRYSNGGLNTVNSGDPNTRHVKVWYSYFRYWDPHCAVRLIMPSLFNQKE